MAGVTGLGGRRQQVSREGVIEEGRAGGKFGQATWQEGSETQREGRFGRGGAMRDKDGE